MSLKVMASIAAWFSSPPQEGWSAGQALSCRLKDGVGTVSHGREINGTAKGMKAVMDVGDHTGAGRRECSLHAGGSWDLGGVLSAEASVAPSTVQNHRKPPRGPFMGRLTRPQTPAQSKRVTLG